MAELLTLFKAVPPDGPFDHSDGNRLSPSQPWPGLWSLPRDDQSVIEDVSQGRRRRALLTDGKVVHLVEYHPGIREVTGDATGYTVRTIAVPAAPEPPRAPASAPAPPTLPPRIGRQTGVALLLAAVMFAAALGGMAGPVVAARASLFCAPPVPEPVSLDRDRQRAELPPAPAPADDRRLKLLQEEIDRLKTQREEDVARAALPRNDERVQKLVKIIKDNQKSLQTALEELESSN